MRTAVFGVVLAMRLIAATAAPVEAHTIVGFTWFSDGAESKQGPPGTVITAYAMGAARNSDFTLIIAKPLTPTHVCLTDAVPINPNNRRSSDNGVIGNTTGAVPSVPPGEWQICFTSISTITITYPRPFIVL